MSGVNNFLDTTFELASKGDEILGPCKKCANCKWHQRNVEDHLVVYGFVQGYTNVFLMEKVFPPEIIQIIIRKVPTCVTILLAYFMILLEMLHLIWGLRE